MIRSPQRRTIRCIYKVEKSSRSETPPRRRLVSLAPEMVGTLCGKVRITSTEIVWASQPNGTRRACVKVKCDTCGLEKAVDLQNLKRGMTNGCQHCSQGKKWPVWLENRLEAAKSRCENQHDANYARYGARGIRFCFPSVVAGTLWVQENLGLHREKQLDRIDNNGHYEPGNLRWVSRRANCNNTRRSTGRMRTVCEVRTQHPEVRYADSTLGRLARIMTTAEIVNRWSNTKSCKPKGVYGTFSTPDQDTVSLLLGG